MAKAAVGAARIEMSINSATFERQMEQARKATSRYRTSLKNVSKQFRKTGKQWQRAGKSMMRNITAPLAAAGVGLIALQKKTGDAAGKLIDMAASTGVSTQALQEYKFAVGEAGIGVDMMQRLMERNNQRMGRAAEGNQNFADTYKLLGVSLRDANGEMRGSEEVFDDVLRGLAGIEDGSKRAAIAGDLLGTNAGRKLAGALNGGIGAMDEARQKAHDLGFVLDQDALQAADEFGKKMDRLKAQITASSQRMAVDLIPMVQDHLIPLFEKGMEKVSGLTDWFTKMDTESQIRIAKIVATIGLLPPAIFAVGTAFVGIAATISALTSPITLVIAAIGGLAAAVTYVADNWDAIKERISDVSWWRNMVINMVQFINDQLFRRIWDGFNAIFKFVGGATLANPFDAVSRGLEALKAETKEYENQFGSFTDAVMNGFQRMTGIDLGGMFTIPDEANQKIKETRDTVNELGPAIERVDFSAWQVPEMDLSGMRVEIDKSISKWDQFKTKFQEIGGEFKSFLAGEMSSAVLSFGDALGRSLAGAENSWQTTFEKIMVVVLDFAASLAKMAAAIGGVMVFIPGLQGAGAGLLAAAAVLQTASSGIKAGIEKRAAARQQRAQETNVNDALVRSDGSVIRFHPDDDLLAMKDFGDLGKQFERPAPQQAIGSGSMTADINVYLDSVHIWRGQQKLQRRRST